MTTGSLEDAIAMNDTISRHFPNAAEGKGFSAKIVEFITHKYNIRRNKILDKQFLLAWESSTVRIGLVTRKQLENHKLSKPNIVKKSGKFTGLEIADLVSYRLSRHVMGKTSKAAGNEIDIKIIASKKVSSLS